MASEAALARLAELREGAAQRWRTMPDYPDPPDEAERAEAEMDGWLALQAQALSGLDA